MLTAVRLSWRLQRFELVVLIGACVALAAACGILAWRLASMVAELESCQRTAAVATLGCQAIETRLNQMGSLVPLFTGLASVAPFLVGIFLGAPLVAREIERGTTSLAWSLSPSRVKWLAYRVLPVAALIVLALLVLGQASESAILAMPSGQLDFQYFAMHGPLLAARGLAVFGIGLVVGALMGRSLPAILVSGVGVVAVLLVLTLVRSQLMDAEAVWIDPAKVDWQPTYIHESGFRLVETGEILTFEEAYERYPEVFEGEQIDPFPPGSTFVERVNPPEQYDGFVLREGLALMGLTVLLGGLAIAIVRVRRP